MNNADVIAELEEEARSGAKGVGLLRLSPPAAPQASQKGAG